MEYIETEIQGVYIIKPKVFLTLEDISTRLGSKMNLSRMSENQFCTGQ